MEATYMERKKKSAAKSLTSKEMKKVKGGRAMATATSVHAPLNVGGADKTLAGSRTPLK
jgi:hypothetical protein